MTGYKKALGARGEEIACYHLESQGYRVTGRNVRVGHDEIDIIAENESRIVFIEVKSRAGTAVNQRYGRPASAVDYTKQSRMLRAVKQYLFDHRGEIAKAPRLDVIEVCFPAIHEDTPIDISKLIPLKVNHITNAVHD